MGQIGDPMDADQELLDAYDAREIDEWHKNKALQHRYESVAKQAHAYRNTVRMLHSIEVLAWEEMQFNSQRHLIADVKNVAENPTISAAELHQMFKERLIAGGDTDSLELGVGDPRYLSVEEAVLKQLKEYLAAPLITADNA